MPYEPTDVAVTANQPTAYKLQPSLYKSLPDRNFWKKSVSQVERMRFDPVGETRFQISKDDKVATAGSCFAQHISARLARSGFTYFVPESGQELDAESRRENGYGVFSARFGNIYTSRQLRQLLEECLGRRAPADTAWRRKDGRFVDPLRPYVQPSGYSCEADVRTARATHLKLVERMFRELDIFVFTLGLTETWCCDADGTAVPLAPGVIAADASRFGYSPANLGIDEVSADMDAVITMLRVINSRSKVLLTVSPVPLIATFEPRNVVVSTTYSKAVLRVAAEQAMHRHAMVDYFPSFEIITGNQSRGFYWESDLREVNPIGVNHAMSCFLRHYARTAPVATTAASDVAGRQPDIICDEEMIVR